jgi:type I restriction enzyme S subunit
VINGKIRFRWLAKEIDKRNSAEVDYPLMSVSQTKGVIPRSELMGNEGRAESLDNYKICLPGQIVINRMSASSGALGLAKQGGLVSPDYAVIEATKLADPRFLEYLMKSSWFVGEMVARLRGIGAGGESASVRTPRINIADLGEIEVSLPPIEEQRRIADYLDEQIGRIDEIISVHTMQLRLHAERFASRLREAIHEKADTFVKLRRISRIINGGTPPPDSENWNGEVIWATPVDLAQCNGLSLSETDRNITRIGLGSTKLLPPHNLVLSTRAPIGYVALNEVEMTFNQGCKGLLIDEEINAQYVKFCLMSFKEELNSLGTGSTFMELSNQSLADLKIPRSSIANENEIVLEVESLQAQLIGFKELISSQVTKLVELKTSLITAAVTGQFDVTTGRSVA